MSILSFIGNTFSTIGDVFSIFFNFIIYNLFVPLMTIFFLVLLIGVQYYLIKLYIFLFTKGVEYGKNLISFLSNWENKILSTFMKY